jgi:hypothetical protein
MSESDDDIRRAVLAEGRRNVDRLAYLQRAEPDPDDDALVRWSKLMPPKQAPAPEPKVDVDPISVCAQMIAALRADFNMQIADLKNQVEELKATLVDVDTIVGEFDREITSLHEEIAGVRADRALDKALTIKGGALDENPCGCHQKSNGHAQ